jgi:hypothetical protein
MTEEEAKTKWCPFARERAKQGMPDGGGNRIPYGCADDGPVEADYIRETAMSFPCIGSACMAWRRMNLPDGDKHFYCGLAGKP